jgi:hypothetical protein
VGIVESWTNNEETAMTTVITNSARRVSRLNHSPFWDLINIGQTLVAGLDDLFSISVATTVVPFDEKTLNQYMAEGFMADDSFDGYIMARGSGSIVHMVSVDSLVYSIEFCLQSMADAGNMESVISFPLPIGGVAALAILEDAGMVNRFRSEMGSVQHARGRFVIEAEGNKLYFKQVSKPVRTSHEKVSDFYPSMALLDSRAPDGGYSYSNCQYH